MQRKFYLLFALKSENFCNEIIKMAVGVRQLNLNLEQCRNIIGPIPPFALQNQFASIVEKVESMKSRYQQSLTELENLYGGCRKCRILTGFCFGLF
jgi:type I restriction enzyme S subunit